MLFDTFTNLFLFLNARNHKVLLEKSNSVFRFRLKVKVSSVEDAKVDILNFRTIKTKGKTSLRTYLLYVKIYVDKRVFIFILFYF